jgi:hypothetical protein
VSLGTDCLIPPGLSVPGARSLSCNLESWTSSHYRQSKGTRKVVRSFDDVARSEQDFAPSGQSRATPEIPVAMPAKPAGSLRFASSVVLAKKEVFEICERVASAQRALLENACGEEAALLGLLIDELEDRLSVGMDMSGDMETPHAGVSRGAVPLSYASV